MEKEFFKPEQETVYKSAELLGKTFVQRRDIFASQLEDGRYVSIKEPLTARHLALHLKGFITLGTYMLAPDSTTRIIAFDADGENGLKDLANLANRLRGEAIPSYLETSRRGGHLWFFFDKSYEGERVRSFGKGIIKKHGVEGVELYPKQDKLYGGPGSLIRLPFGIHKRSGKKYPFIFPDGEMLAPSVREQIYVLSTPQTVPEASFDAYVGYLSEKQRKRAPRSSYKAPESGFVETLKSAIPLMDFLSAFIELRPVASGAVGRCPFHNDQNPSFGVNRDGNYWQCFAGCGSGSIIDFWMKWRECTFDMAISELARMLL